ncbi:MAG: histidine phosphatase family protein [Deltaproteobacteria bacterium]|nr:MAG: histidine phosphatase family protein [Deltaproteobacteria bacterium]
MTERSPVTHFGLLRHAMTEWNRERRIQGQTDTPLSPLGERQAEQWGHILKAYPWDRILVSDARRAVETAAMMNTVLEAPMDSDSRLREQDWGEWTGKTISQLKREAPLLLAEQEKAGWNFCPPAGEDRLMVRDRSLKAIVGACEKWGGERILVVTHEGVIKCLLYDLCGRRFLPGEPGMIRPRSLHWLIHDQHGLRIENMNAMTLP